MTIIMALSVLMVIPLQASGTEIRESILYTSHEPIRINNNTGFIATNGVIGGTGAPNDPYLIEGWEINGKGCGYALFIGNTTANFVVRNNKLFDANSSGNSSWGGSKWNFHWDSGIALFNVRNGIIINNTISNDAGSGIYITQSDYNLIIGNTVSGNEWSNIRLNLSRQNQISQNILSDSFRGIFFDFAGNNFLMFNEVMRNFYGVDSWWSNNNSILNNSIYNNKISGIDFMHSNYSLITNNHVTNNQGTGIALLYSSNGNYLTYNSIANNPDGGVRTSYGSSLNRIHHNTFIRNSLRGWIQVSDESGPNYWNDTRIGNYWDDFDEPSEGCYDLNFNGICDRPYYLYPGLGEYDYHPITYQDTRPLYYTLVFLVLFIPSIPLLVIAALYIRNRVRYRNRQLRHR